MATSCSFLSLAAYTVKHGVFPVNIPVNFQIVVMLQLVHCCVVSDSYSQKSYFAVFHFACSRRLATPLMQYYATIANFNI